MNNSSNWNKNLINLAGNTSPQLFTRRRNRKVNLWRRRLLCNKVFAAFVKALRTGLPRWIGLWKQQPRYQHSLKVLQFGPQQLDIMKRNIKQDWKIWHWHMSLEKHRVRPYLHWFLIITVHMQISSLWGHLFSLSFDLQTWTRNILEAWLPWEWPCTWRRFALDGTW